VTSSRRSGRGSCWRFRGTTCGHSASGPPCQTATPHYLPAPAGCARRSWRRPRRSSGCGPCPSTRRRRGRQTGGAPRAARCTSRRPHRSSARAGRTAVDASQNDKGPPKRADVGGAGSRQSRASWAPIDAIRASLSS